jgi:hypothetical protein
VEQSHQPIEVDGKQVGRWSKDGAGRLIVQIDAAYVSEDGHQAVLKSIAAALRR